MRKEPGNPLLHYPTPPFTLGDLVIQFDTDIDPHRMGFRRLVNVLVTMKMNITEDDGVSTA
jgi:hypothetical protein